MRRGPIEVPYEAVPGKAQARPMPVPCLAGGRSCNSLRTVRYAYDLPASHRAACITYKSRMVPLLKPSHAFRQAELNALKAIGSVHRQVPLTNAVEWH